MQCGDAACRAAKNTGWLKRTHRIQKSCFGLVSIPDRLLIRSSRRRISVNERIIGRVLDEIERIDSLPVEIVLAGEPRFHIDLPLCENETILRQAK